MRILLVSGVSVSALVASAAGAQSAPPGNTSGATTARPSAAAVDDRNTGIDDIIVTAQRQSQSLQDVPIAISAFTAEALEKQQINNASDLQLSLPNITFTKTNFTGASFTIRGIGDLCVGGTCDSATAIHVNDLPLFGTRLFETEYFDLERVEVLRGPQGTLFGRNATAGVVNFITAKPVMKEFHASAEGEYGNYNTYKAKGIINVPLGDTIAARLAGFYLKRDGYTENVYNGDKLDGRKEYALRASLRWKPDSNTTVDLMGYYFHENDNRLRIQKQLCQRDPTGVLGCLPGKNDFGTTNANSTFVGTLSSREFLTTQGGAAIGALGLGSLYGPDAYQGNINPDDVRKVSTDYTPKYFTDEIQASIKIDHDFGDFSVKVSGLYQRNKVDSQQDYNLSVQNRSVYAQGLNTLAAYAGGAGGAYLASIFGPAANVLIPNGPNGQLCTSQAETTGTGAYGGHAFCANTPEDYDRSTGVNQAYTGEAILSSHFDGKFNFLIGGIYNRLTTKNLDYYVNSFGIDYIAGVLGAATTLGQQGAGNTTFPVVYLGSPFYRNNQQDYSLNSYGIFAEGYVDITDRLKATVGIRYNNDRKSVTQRTALAAFAVPYGTTDAFDSPFVGTFDADPGIVGNQLFQKRKVKFGEFTGRAVLDFKITDDNLLYASYSRGYKSGGINPPLSPIFAVNESFSPEFIDAFEVGSKNTFLDGTLRLNLTGFYYKYKGLQLSRIVARTSVNDNVNANIYGIEADAIIEPIRALQINLGFSYLHTKVADDKFLSNPRDPSGGRSDAVIIKDIANGSNCAVVPTVAGNAAGSNAFVGFVNSQINAGLVPGLMAGAGLQAPTAFPTGSGINGATGAFGVCAALSGYAAAAGAAFGGIAVLNEGVTVNVKGNQLPQAPNFKASGGMQYTFEFGNGMSLVPRYDITMTGTSFGSIFNGAAPGQTRAINRIPSYVIQNAQIQLNGKDDKWFLRGYIQNLTNSNATTGLYVTDQSSGLFTNIFTLEPRRYGIAGGVRF
ncbi:TonB-dependent receptor [Sphingosinicellaceae bacterium]|nr:TonB-dependent receptor [Sphingosinicellaceae bacterium]